MQNDPAEWDDDQGIDIEAFLQALLALSGDKERRASLIQKVSKHSGVTPENVDQVIAAVIQYLSNQSRSN